MLWTSSAAGQTVEGHVINSATGTGIADVKVDLLAIGAVGYSTSTDANGHFRLEDVKDGAYHPRYSSPGFWQFPDPSPPFAVIAGREAVKLQARLIPGCRLSGRVIDGRGEPVANARLELAYPGLLLPRVLTDSDGKFDVNNLPLFTGAYTLAVMPPLGLKPPDPEPDTGRVLGWARTYYPGVVVPDAASKILLRPGGELTNIELKLMAVPTYAVRGVLRNRDGTPAPKALSLGDEAVSPAYRVTSKPDGTFEFPAVVDGIWRIWADAESDGMKLRASLWIEVAGREVEDITLQLEAPFMVQGRTVIEGPKGSAPPQGGGAALLVPVNPSRRPGSEELPMMVPRDADGNFNVHPVYPGMYQISVRVSPPYYLSGVRLGEADLTGPEIAPSSGAIPITLVYRADGGTVRGSVEKCASGEVILLPQDPVARWPGFIQRTRCDSNDHYEIAAVRPGAYYALAFSGNTSSPFPASSFLVPNFDDGILNQAGRITVRAGEVSSADLRAIIRPTY